MLTQSNRFTSFADAEMAVISTFTQAIVTAAIASPELVTVLKTGLTATDVVMLSEIA